MTDVIHASPRGTPLASEREPQRALTERPAAPPPQSSGLSQCNCRLIDAPHSYVSHLIWGAGRSGDLR
jgi:hypothetical protein